MKGILVPQPIYLSIVRSQSYSRVFNLLLPLFLNSGKFDAHRVKQMERHDNFIEGVPVSVSMFSAQVSNYIV